MGSKPIVLDAISPLMKLQQALAKDEKTPSSVAEETLAHANANASHNTYLWLHENWLRNEASALERQYTPTQRSALYGVPVSLKDCFDLAGAPTSAGTRFYAQRLSVAARDSVVAQRLKAAGALIMGKTHLHPLAYGITGENPDYGDCLQPRDPKLLTGGSSSGAAASVQEGSAVIAIGTDTGGSVRVPAALCGLAGYRISHRVAFEPGKWSSSPEGLWTGGIHLAESFDTVGVFARDPRDLAAAVSAVFALPASAVAMPLRFGCVSGPFLHDCDAEVLDASALWQKKLTAEGWVVEEFEPDEWEGAAEIFSSIQAHEAAALHRGHYDAFEPAIAQRLRSGAELTEVHVAELRARMQAFCERLMSLFDRFDFLTLPCAPINRLYAGKDQTSVRPRILKYTTPFSLAGLPVLALPGEMVGGALGSGIQIAAKPGEDSKLLGLAHHVGAALAAD